MGTCRLETWEQNPFSSCQGVSFPELSTPQEARPPHPGVPEVTSSMVSRQGTHKL